VLNTAGVLGIAGSRTGVGGIAGVWGDAQEHVGVIGSSKDYSGIYGASTHSYGVQAVTTGVSAGVYGVGGSSTTSFNIFGPGPVGVWGDVTGSSSEYSVAVAGTGQKGDAAQFFNDSDDSPTVYAYNDAGGGNSNDIPFKTFEASTPNGSCGFGGNGDMTCTGQLKSLATTGARIVETYAMQSPENWMEDFGSGTLNSGITTVSIDAAFAETVSGNEGYHVFLTPQGDSKGLYVTNRTATSFEVHESGGGTSTISFDYRIVAKRRGFETQRMVDVTDAMSVVKARNIHRAEQFKKAVK
jgi:hypothetical protein